MLLFFEDSVSRRPRNDAWDVVNQFLAVDFVHAWLQLSIYAEQRENAGVSKNVCGKNAHKKLFVS